MRFTFITPEGGTAYPLSDGDPMGGTASPLSRDPIGRRGRCPSPHASNSAGTAGTPSLPLMHELNSKPSRKHPARGVYISSAQPTIVFLTVCAKNRQPWLAQGRVHEA